MYTVTIKQCRNPIPDKLIDKGLRYPAVGSIDQVIEGARVKCKQYFAGARASVTINTIAGEPVTSRIF